MWHLPNSNFRFPEKNKSLFPFHINTCSLSKTFHGLEDLLKSTNKIFDIVLVSETRITKKTSLNSNINLQYYSFEFMPTESNAGGTLLYIVNHWSHKPRTDLNLNIVYQMESNFIEKKNSRKSNIIVGCLYKHLNMGISDFNQNYLNTLLDKLSKKTNRFFFMSQTISAINRSGLC